jgi:hypothetical protein
VTPYLSKVNITSTDQAGRIIDEAVKALSKPGYSPFTVIAKKIQDVKNQGKGTVVHTRATFYINCASRLAAKKMGTYDNKQKKQIWPNLQPEVYLIRLLGEQLASARAEVKQRVKSRAEAS